jgi:hypothetical protein
MVAAGITVAEGSAVIVGLLVLGFFVLAYSLYTRRGSGISGHPYGDASGPETPEEAGEEIRNMGRGTAGHHGGPPREAD